MATIFFTGFMGAGKSTMARLVANEFRMQFFDTDQMIVDEEKKSIAEIFKQKGEAYFREKEKKILKKITPRGMVVALGGGIIKDNENVKLIKKLGKVMYLEENCYTVLDRLADSFKTRPLLEGHFNEEDLSHMISVRDPLYRQLCDATVNVDNKTKDEVFLSLLPYINEWNKLEVVLKIM